MIYVYENGINERPLHEMIKYSSQYIPRVGEFLFFPHLGGFIIENVVYEISDDSEPNEVMWISVFVKKLQGDNQ